MGLWWNLAYGCSSYQNDVLCVNTVIFLQRSVTDEGFLSESQVKVKKKFILKRGGLDGVGLTAA